MLSGLPVRATIPGLGVLPKLTVGAVNLTVALGTGPLAMAFSASALGLAGRGALGFYQRR